MSKREQNSGKRLLQRHDRGSNKRKLELNKTSIDLEIVLLIDRQELNHSASRRVLENSLKRAGILCEERPLPAADYLWIMKQNGEEYVLPFLVERKTAVDLARSISEPTKSFPPLTRAELQMYKMEESGIDNKTWLIEGFTSGNAQDYVAYLRRDRRDFTVKETNDLRETIDFLADTHRTVTDYAQKHPPSSTTLTYFELWDRIDDALHDPSFLWKLRLLQVDGVGNLESKAIVKTFPSEDAFKRETKRMNGRKRVKMILEKLELKPGHVLGSATAERILQEFGTE